MNLNVYLRIVPQVVFVGVCSQMKALSLTAFYSIESKHEVTILGGLNEFVVKFFGPQGSKCFSFLIIHFFSLLTCNEVF